MVSTGDNSVAAQTHVPRSDALGVFTFLWAQVMVLQVVKLSIPLASGSQAWEPTTLFWPSFMACSCFAGVILPHSGFATLLLTIGSLLVLGVTGSQSNHVFMDMAVSLAVLSAYSRDRARWQAQAAHAVKMFLIVLYAVTALHKMNADWCKVQHSCSTMLLAGNLALPPLRWLLPLTPMAAIPSLATFTELALPSMLLWGRWPRLTTIFGISFHIVLCQMLPPMSVYPFSILMAPLYVFVIERQSAAMFDCLRPWAWVVILAYAIAVVAWTPFMASDLGPNETLFEYPNYGMWAPGLVWCNFVSVALLVAAMWPAAATDSEQALERNISTWRGQLLAVAVLVFGLSPYMGLRNYPALAMFSNLRTEGGRSNHFFIGDDFDLLGWQRDYVTIHETDIPALRLLQVDLGPLFTSSTKATLAEAGILSEFWITPPLRAWPYAETREFRPYSVPFMELRRRIAPLRSTHAKGSLHYSRTVARARLAMPWLWHALGIKNAAEDTVHANITYDLVEGGDPELERPLPIWQAVVARFRSFDVDYSPCRH